MDHDITRDEPWNSLCTAAATGRVAFVGGSPGLTSSTKKAARTRVFSDLDFWGYPSNCPEDQRTHDLQSLAILRFMCLAHLAMRVSQGQAAIFLGNTSDHGKFPGTHGTARMPRLWTQRWMVEWRRQLGLDSLHFD